MRFYSGCRAPEAADKHDSKWSRNAFEKDLEETLKKEALLNQMNTGRDEIKKGIR